MKKPPSLFEARPDGGGAARADHGVVDIESLDGRARRELISASAEFQCGPDFLGSEETSLAFSGTQR